MGWFRSKPADRGDVEPSFEERLEQIRPGVPGHCPACDGLGYIDNIDIGHRYQIQHCKDCLHRWEYLFDGDGRVVGLTELDADGRPITRTRVRPERSAPEVSPSPSPAPAEPAAGPAPSDSAVDDDQDADDQDVIVDVRDSVVAEGDAPDLTEPAELSPADWLRRSLRR